MSVSNIKPGMDVSNVIPDMGVSYHNPALDLSLCPILLFLYSHFLLRLISICAAMNTHERNDTLNIHIVISGAEQKV